MYALTNNERLILFEGTLWFVKSFILFLKLSKMPTGDCNEDYNDDDDDHNDDDHDNKKSGDTEEESESNADKS